MQRDVDCWLMKSKDVGFTCVASLYELCFGLCHRCVFGLRSNIVAPYAYELLERLPGIKAGLLNFDSSLSVLDAFAVRLHDVFWSRNHV